MDNFNTSLLFFTFLLILSQAKAFNITTLLSHYSSFSDFNNYLTQTGVAAEINSRQTITVLVVENNNLSPLSGKPQDVIANIMRVHVLLDYYDVDKMHKLPNNTAKAPTLFQTTGQASNDEGFLNMTHLGSGSISLGSAVKGATLGSNVVKSVASQRYNISILQISNVIIPLGIDSSDSPSSPSSSPTHAPAPSPGNNNPSSAPSPTPISTAPAPSMPLPNTPSAAPGPAPDSSSSPASGPAAAEASPAPAPHGLSPNSNAPIADTPAGASPDADVPAADTPIDAPAPESPSASSVLGVSSLVFVTMSNLFIVLIT
ncbi:hypothetical protein HAX54_001623 [Datura stramonium]|uniref:FAS1 domain-containing protein n=1 Tax=Datura stramonium TaxID=4076 RepID=A0ABS8T3A0_DATST|nr:hypothetical protein [Datura stramonium]